MTLVARRASLALVLLSCVAVLVATRAELAISREPLNDHALHLPLAAEMSDALRGGGNPLDAWMPAWSLGHPVPRTYQPLAPLLVGGLHAALLARVDIATIFVLAHWLMLGLMPLAMFAGARWLGLERRVATAVAILTPLVSTDLLFGLELSSYCWRGSGLFTQELANVLLPLAVGLGARALRGQGRLSVAALMLAVTFAAHFVFGLIGALALVLVALVRTRRDGEARPVATRLVRLATLGALSFALAAWLLVPLVLDGAFINHSRWEDAWKWDSFGATRVARLLLTGELLDHGRLPVLSLLALAGAGLVATRVALGRASHAESVVLGGSALFLLLACGRPAWDGLFDLLFMGDVPLHRLVAGVHLFLVMLAAVALAALVDLPARGWLAGPGRARRLTRLLAGPVLAALVLAPAVHERLAWLAVSEAWGRETVSLTRAESADIAATMDACRERGGRAFAGPGGGWGKEFGVRWTPMHAFLSRERIPQVSYLYHAMALTSDIMVRFDESNPAHWRLFDVRTGIAPLERDFGEVAPEIARAGRFKICAGPGGGMFEVVDVVGAVRCDRRSFYDVVDAWMSSEGPARRRHLALDLEGRFPEPGFRSQPADARLEPGDDAELGAILRERGEGGRVAADVAIAGAHAWVMLKATWHPGWRARVDGVPAPTSHVTPGFVAVRVPGGAHEVSLEYAPGPLKSVLLWLAPLVFLGALALERRGSVARAGDRLARAIERAREAVVRSARAREIAGVLGLALVAGMPLLLDGHGSGHDAIVHPARVVEAHESFRHGILLPRWAPDLSSGQGQPLFLFVPPLPTWLAGGVHGVTGDAARAMPLAAFAALLVGIFAMRRAARLVAGETGAWAGAAAFALAPYVLTDLHVRAALNESIALSLAPVAILGLGMHARGAAQGLAGAAQGLAVAALGTGLVGLSHHAMALMLVPALLVLAAFFAREARSWWLFLAQAAAVTLGVAIACVAWAPGLFEASLVHLERARADYFSWRVHLVAPWQLLWSPWGYGISQEGTGDGMSFALGPAHLLLALAAVGITAWRGGPDRPLVRGLAAVVLATGLLMTPLGAPAWEALPLLSFVQFPWRLSALCALALALLVALACAAIARVVPARARRFVGPAIVLALIAAGYPLARPAERWHPDPLALAPDEIARRGVLVTSVEEFEPASVTATPAFTPELATVRDGLAVVRVTRETPERWRVTGHAALPSTIVLRLADFPGWRVEGEGEGARATQIEPEPGTGRVRLAVPAGPLDTSLVLRRTSAQRVSLAITILATLILAVAALAPGAVARVASRAPLPGEGAERRDR